MADIDEQAKPISTDQPETVESLAKDITDSVSPALEYAGEIFDRFVAQFSTSDGLIVLGVLAAAFALALALRRSVNRGIDHIWPTEDGKTAFMGNLKHVVKRIALPIVAVVLLWGAIPVLRNLGITNDLLRVVASMLQAWIVINLFSAIVHDQFWSRAFALIAWSLAALYILRLLNPVIALLDSVGMTVGAGKVTVYDVIKGTVLMIVLIWLALTFVRFVKSRLSRSQTLTPSIQSLIMQTVKIGALFVAVLLALNAIGVDLTALAVFSGAVGVGVGIGLQSIVANLMSGVTLLIEGSVKVGDFIELQSGVRGEVKEISTRATRITTNDSVDILVPNSEFINGQVTNWTLRERHCRTRIPFGVAYGTDKELVRKAALEAAAALPYELKGPGSLPAQVWLTGFGDSSLDFQLVLWLDPDAVKRPDAVRAEYNWAIETALGKYGIEIPFPQRDLHIRSGELPIRLERSGKEAT